MPKRKYVSANEFDKLCKKLSEIEKHLKNKRRRHRSPDTSSSEGDSQACWSESDDHPLMGTMATTLEETDVIPGPSCQVIVPTEQTNAEPVAASSLTPSASAGIPAQSSVPDPSNLLDTFTSAQENDISNAESVSELDADVLEILGVDPTQIELYGKPIQKDVAVRFQHVATNGLTKEDRSELLNKYLIPENCKLIAAPTLNPEVKIALSETVIKRDGVIESKQKLMATAISSLGTAITLLLASKDKNTELLRLLMDISKTLCDCQFHESNVRRNFVAFSVKKDMKESLQGTKVDSFLFGQNLSETIKTAKIINKQGAELKAVNPKPSTSNTTSSKNWRGRARTNMARAQPQTSKKSTPKTTTSTATKDQRGGSYRRLQSHRGGHSRR